MPTNTKFSQRNSAAGTMTGSQVAMGVATGKMSAKDVSNAMGKPAKGSSSSTKTSTATKTSGSNVKPTTTNTKTAKGMKTQNIPEVNVSVTKKKVVAPVAPKPEAVKPVNRVTDHYIVREPGGDYKELTYNEYQTYKGPGNKQKLTPSMYESNKGRITTLKKPDPAKN